MFPLSMTADIIVVIFINVARLFICLSLISKSKEPLKTNEPAT